MSFLGSRWSTVALMGLTVAAYAPCINNGFIADDFVLLHNVETVKADPRYLIESAPDLFRVTSYAAFGALKTIFGPDYRAFYVANILLHLLNVLLLRRLVRELFDSAEAGLLAAALFAVFQAPQEAVMWLAAMNETLQGFFLLATALLWIRQQRGWAAAAYSFALISKESAPVLLLILPLMESGAHKRGFLKHYLPLVIPAAVFALAFAGTASSNFMIRNGTYAPGLHALSVFIRSMHRLLWPWAYVLLVLVWIAKRRLPELRQAAKPLVSIGAVMLPYTFLRTGNAIPSRQLYLASAVLVSVLAVAAAALSPRMRIGWVSAFLAFNMVYMWVRKDAQMEERAAPTTALIEELNQHMPGPVLVVNFPYPYPVIAKAAASTVPGWRWDFVEAGTAATRCDACLVLEWDAARRKYQTRRQSRVRE
jgi:hypothetical protein